MPGPNHAGAQKPRYPFQTLFKEEGGQLKPFKQGNDSLCFSLYKSILTALSQSTDETFSGLGWSSDSGDGEENGFRR